MKLSENVRAIEEEKEFISRLALADSIRRNKHIIKKQERLEFLAGPLPEETPYAI